MATRLSALSASFIHDHDTVMNVAPTIVSSRTPIPNVILMLLNTFFFFGADVSATAGALALCC